ncbi:MAG: hypothetical protein J0I20_05030 [Chloroflexi bacterium]|nr:hypothetical protein [Chloroflexota bacterium]OJV97789.1 MAG: hypothetical protein BGO39_07675 [Chloroflexi bacterium 54-19]
MRTSFIKRATGSVLAALVVFGLLVALTPGQASAHGRKDLVGGKYQIIFGFLTEPAFSGQRNGIDLTVCLGPCENNADGTLKNPVTGADKTIKAEVTYGSSTVPVTLAPRFRADGKYDGYFFPSKAGEYTFHFTGNINGDTIDQKVVSARDGFNSVSDPLMIPASGSDTAGGLAEAQQAAQSAKDSASTATIFGIVGIVVGVLGLALAGFALTRRPKVVAANGATAAVPAEPVASRRGSGPEGG